MRSVVRLLLTLAATSVPAARASAQLGELQFGLLASYATGNAYGPGVGVVLGVAPGRIGYVGLRWTYHTDVTTHEGANLEVTTGAHVFAADLGFLIPVRKVEVTPSVSLGMVRFAQEIRQSTTGGGAAAAVRQASEFFVAPGMSVTIYVAKVALIPELQYRFVGAPALARTVHHFGPVATLRLVIPLEVGHIRR